MRIHLDRIGDEPFRWRETRQLEAASLERPEVVGLGEIAWHGTITQTGTGHLFQGQLHYEQTLTCQRCLVESSTPVSADVELLLVPDGEEPVEGEVELEDDELNVLFVPEGLLDTEPILVEQVHLNVPMRALCQESCAGLCPECGVDRNRETCGCEDSAIDPRWSALRDLSSREE